MTPKKPASEGSLQSSRSETQAARVETQKARAETQNARNETQGERNRVQGDANEATGEQNRIDIEGLGERVDALIKSNQVNAEGISTVATLLHESRVDRRLGRFVTLIVAIFLAVVGWLLYQDLRDAKDQRMELLQISERIADATNPDGCMYQRGQAGTAAAIHQINNDNRVLHGYAPIPLAPAIAKLIQTPCPGESLP